MHLKKVLPLAAFLLAASPIFAAHTRGAKMTIDTADQACVQLKDQNKWTSSLADLDGVGTNYTLSSFVSNHLIYDGTELTSSNHPPAAGYGNGFKWNSGDETTQNWVPQGLTIGSANSDELVFVSWHGQNDSEAQGTRLTIANVQDLSHVTYRHVVMVLPTGAGTYEPILEHAGGIGAVINGYLYISEASGLHVFDLNHIRKVNQDNCTTSGGAPIFGKNSAGQYCAGGWEFMLPQVNEYYVPSTMSDGTAIPASCKPKFSFAGVDWRRSTNYMLSGEYCGTASGGEPCNGDSTYLNGRLYMWPMTSDGKLVTSGGYVTPWRVYYMNESDVQGVAVDNNTYIDDNGNTAYPTDTYFLSSTYQSGHIYRAGLNNSTLSWSYANDAPFHPEGMYATGTPNMWIVTEGCCSSSDPSSTGRSVFYVHQSSY